VDMEAALAPSYMVSFPKKIVLSYLELFHLLCYIYIYMYMIASCVVAE
jgi:hypothetical protein